MAVFVYSCKSCGTSSEVKLPIGSDIPKTSDCSQCGSEANRKWTAMSFNMSDEVDDGW